MRCVCASSEVPLRSGTRSATRMRTARPRSAQSAAVRRVSIGHHTGTFGAHPSSWPDGPCGTRPRQVCRRCGGCAAAQLRVDSRRGRRLSRRSEGLGGAAGCRACTACGAQTTRVIRSTRNARDLGEMGNDVQRCYATDRLAGRSSRPGRAALRVTYSSAGNLAQ